MQDTHLLADLCRERGVDMDLLIHDDTGYWRALIKDISVDRMIRFDLAEVRTVRWVVPGGWVEEPCTREDSLAAIRSYTIPVSTVADIRDTTVWFFLPVSGRGYFLKSDEEIPAFA